MSYFGSLSSFLPRVKIAPSTTFGQLADGLWFNYSHRMVYPLIGWGALVFYLLSPRAVSPAEKHAILVRERKLQSLEFHQD